MADLHILSMLNGTFAMSKQGPKSAEQRARGGSDKAPTGEKDYIISKSKTAGIYVKHMVSEIILLLACNK
mgnify:CR=1 FL=1